MIAPETMDKLRWAVAQATADLKPAAEMALTLAEAANRQEREADARIAALERQALVHRSEYERVATDLVKSLAAVKHAEARVERRKVQKIAAATADEIERACGRLERATKTATEKAVDMVVAIAKLIRCDEHGKSPLRCTEKYGHWTVLNPDGGSVTFERRAEAIECVKSLVEAKWALVERKMNLKPNVNDAGGDYGAPEGQRFDAEDAEDSERARRRGQPGEVGVQRTPAASPTVGKSAGSGRLDGVKLSTTRQIKRARLL